MSALTVPLTVRSVNGKNVATSYTQIFSIDRIYGLRSNQNAYNAMTFTDSNVAANTVDHTSWTFTFKGERPTYLYWAATYVATTATISVYSNSTRTNLVASGTCTIGGGSDVACWLSEVNGSGISGYVLVDKDLATTPVGTITIAGQVTSADLSLNGDSELMEVQANGTSIKYTVTETVTQIQTLIGAGELLEATVTLTSTQLLAGNTTPISIITAPAAGTFIEVIAASASVDFATTAYANNTQLNLIFAAGTATWTCAGILAATGDQTNKFLSVAGQTPTATALKAQVATGDPINGDSPVTVRVLYRLVTV